MKVSIIGVGAMGGAIADGLVRAGGVELMLANPSDGALRRFADMPAAAGVRVTSDNCEAARFGDFVILAVKPWLVERVAQEIRQELDYYRQKVVVVAAGISFAQLIDRFCRDGMLPTMAIGMPNTAVAVGESMTFLVSDSSDKEALGEIKGLFDLMGTTLMIDEAHLPAATTLASCGIAYAMRYIRASMEGGVELGFKAAVAQEIVAQTVKGAAALLSVPGSHPESEIDKVTTPGGLTIKGLNEMEHAGFTSAVIRGLKAGIRK